MSERDVYKDEMPTMRLSDQDAELILTGQEPEDANLARLGGALKALHTYDDLTPSEEAVSRFAAEAAALARESKPDIAPSATSTSRPRRVARVFREKLAVVAISVFVLAGMSGVAAASDDAMPGDLLYGLDRTLESIGINDGGTAERIAEAQDLANEGQVSLAITHVATAMEDSDEGQPETDFSPERADAAEALRSAASEVESQDAEPSSEEMRAAVGAMLEEMAEMLGNPDFDGAEFGQRVSEMARSIGRDQGTEEEIPGSDPPDHAGPPEDGGPPDHAGPPEGDESPGAGNPPDDPGPPQGTPGPPGGSPGGGRP